MPRWPVKDKVEQSEVQPQKEVSTIQEVEEVTSDEPIRYAYTAYRSKGGWVAEHLEIQGDRVIKRKVTEPNMRLVTLGQAQFYIMDNTK